MLQRFQRDELQITAGRTTGIEERVPFPLNSCYPWGCGWYPYRRLQRPLLRLRLVAAGCSSTNSVDFLYKGEFDPSGTLFDNYLL